MIDILYADLLAQYQILRQKREAETLTDSEHDRLIQLSTQIEQYRCPTSRSPHSSRPSPSSLPLRSDGNPQSPACELCELLA